MQPQLGFKIICVYLCKNWIRLAILITEIFSFFLYLFHRSVAFNVVCKQHAPLCRKNIEGILFIEILQFLKKIQINQNYLGCGH